MPIFQPSMMKSSSSSRARGGGDAGSQTSRCSVTPIRCMHRRLWTNILVVYHRPHHNHHNHHTRFFKQVCVFFLCDQLCSNLNGWLAMAARDDAGGGTGSARRRRERRLRSFLRHERTSVAMALAESTHHSAQRQKTARAGGKARDVLHGQVQGAPLPLGGRPAPLSEVAGWEERVQRHCVENLAEVCPVVQILDADVPATLLVEQYAVIWNMEEDILAAADHLDRDFQVPELVIEVPKISLDVHDVPPRRLCRDTQMAEQLVEVPTIVSYSWLQLGMEQNVDIPVPGRGGRIAGLQGFLPGQSSTATHSSVERISERIVEQIAIPSSEERISERVEQIVDFPVSRGGLQDSQAASSSVSTGHAGDTVLDMPGVVLPQVPGLMGQKTVVVPQLHSIDGRRLPLRAAEAPCLFGRS